MNENGYIELAVRTPNLDIPMILRSHNQTLQECSNYAKHEHSFIVTSLTFWNLLPESLKLADVKLFCTTLISAK